MFCSKCGNINPDNSKFCRSCGSPFPTNEPGPQQPVNTSGSQPSINASGQQPPVNTPGAQPPVNTPGVQPPVNTPGAQPPQSGYIPPANNGYASAPGNLPRTPYQQGGGYTNPGMGYSPQAPGSVPPKKKKTGLVVALIVLCIALFATPIIILSSLNNIKSNSDSNASSNVVMADDIEEPSGQNNDGTDGSGNNDSSPAVTGLADDGFRHNYTQIIGGGEDIVTVMIYICGADLESMYGCGTLDINEILAADLGDNVNVIIETGGCTNWDAPYITDGEVQRWSVEDGELVLLEDLGSASMLDTTELVDFIEFSAENYPANRYDLVLWDHGGGALYGYGSDELYPNGVLYINEIARALKATGIKFDFVGFDACLMGTLETAYMLEPYADYMIASEETEPAYGWNYTPWLSALGDDPSIDTVALGEIVVDSFIQQNSPASEYGDTTLSVVALREIPYVYDTLCAYMSNANEALYNEQFTMISSAVAYTKAFAEGYNLDMIDIIDFAERSDLEGSAELEQALSSAVKYANSSLRSGAYGLSLYFPYTDLSVYGYAKDMFSEFGFGDSIYDFYDSFVNILAGGQLNSSSRSLMENMTGVEDAQTDYSGYEWYDDSAAQDYTYDDINYTELEIFWDDINGYYYLPLTDEDWELITAVEMQILLDDGEGYIDLGSDQYFELDDYGNLLLNYGADNTWVAIGGQVVCYYAEEIVDMGDHNLFVGYVPAMLNGTTYIEIILEWEGTDAYIAGYRTMENNSEFGGAGTLGKGLNQFEPGDVVDYICDYYTYDGEFDASYYFGDTMVMGEILPAVTYEDVGDAPVLECYMLVDIYQNYSWTETVIFSY